MNPTNLGVTDFSIVNATLDSNNAYKFMSGIEGDLKFGTGPVRSAYFMLSSTELQPDLDALTGSGFLSTWNYPRKNVGVVKSSLMDFELLTMAA